MNRYVQQQPTGLEDPVTIQWGDKTVTGDLPKQIAEFFFYGGLSAIAIYGLAKLIESFQK